MFYSVKNNTWYAPDFRADYEAAGTWPDDAKEYPREVYDEVVTNRPADKVMIADKNGDPILADPPPPTSEQEAKIYAAAIQAHLDAAAVAHGYDDIKTAVTYAEEPSVPKFQNDGKAFRAWRSKVWEYAYAQLDLVNSGKRDKPSVDQLLGELPLLSGV
ncbi:hypothetical protein HQ393_04880 [Chitinibacter bivalviorum]|uniref:Tail fiber assembly protein n=1 Tax=Chitinibacter bivalviorum TaxID=2739434 RepID=A0A7H9BG12_9NEIS|nr:hypothetical protein [Chitinibacter bivalviorum]QLG87640.1 hypothetical protein HQ393_04880 [Chitinibacter bivalviorum]